MRVDVLALGLANLEQGSSDAHHIDLLLGEAVIAEPDCVNCACKQNSRAERDEAPIRPLIA
jgi:hypothetical protein